MVNFLKVYGPLRILFLLIVLILIRLPFYLKGIPLTVPELKWLLVGEKIASGFTMYKEVWEPMEPFSAGFYGLMNLIFGKTTVIFKILSLVIIYFQAVFINLLFNQFNVYNERSTIPGFLYVALSVLFFDFLTLPPLLLGMCFLLPSLYFILYQIKYRPSDETMLYIGLLTGISSLFYLPFSLFLPMTILVLLLFTATSFNKYLLLITGFLLPFLLTYLYYFYLDAGDDFLENFVIPFLVMPARRFTEIKVLGIVFLIPAILIILGFVAVSSRASYINYQYNLFKVMILWLVTSLGTLFLTLKFAPYQLYIFTPAIAYFGTHYFLLSRSRLLPEISIWSILIALPLISAGLLYGFIRKEGQPPLLKEYLVQETRNKPGVSLEGRKILVVGYEPELYKNSILATPYLNWQLAEKHFLNLNNYQALSELYKNFSQDPPEVIIDRKGIMEKVFFRLPNLGKRYRKLENESVWVLIP